MKNFKLYGSKTIRLTVSLKKAFFLEIWDAHLPWNKNLISLKSSQTFENENSWIKFLGFKLFIPKYV